MVTCQSCRRVSVVRADGEHSVSMHGNATGPLTARHIGGRVTADFDGDLEGWRSSFSVPMGWRGSRRHVLEWTEQPQFLEELADLVRPAPAHFSPGSQFMPKGREQPQEARLETFGRPAS